MQRKLTQCLYLLVFTTLFLLISSSNVLAITSEEILEQSGYEVVRYKSKATNDNGDPLYSYEVIKIPYNTNSGIYDEDTGKLKIAEDTFARYRITYSDENGIRTYEPNLGYDDEGNLLLMLSDELKDGSTYQLSLVESSANAEETGRIVEGQTRSVSLDSIQTMAEPKKTTFISGAWTVLTEGLDGVAKVLTETLCKMLIPMGDSFLDMISNAMGEVVTIDGVVYNRVQKVDIDYFDNTSNTQQQYLNSPLKSVLKNAVNNVYIFFRNIVIVFYLAMLVFIGVRILFTSTAAKKASYKTLLMAWVMGIVMIAFFPYVMKYSIQLNSALCQMISNDNNSYTSKPINGLNSETYGTDEFVTYMLLGNETTNNNAMMNVRFIGAKTWNIPLIIVYFIFIGQLIAILVMYYKRVFMIGFLIAIFPVVVAIYPLNKIGTVKINPFGIWFKEFMVNVFVQSFHAATYKVIVEVGVEAYKQSQNWLFLIICVLFLFEGEKLLRAIFNAKSGASTIGDMAMAGAFAMKMMKSVGSAIPTINKKDEEEDEDGLAKEKAIKDAKRKSTTSSATASNREAVGALTSGGEGASTGSGGTSASGVGTVTTEFVATPVASNNTKPPSFQGTSDIDNKVKAMKKQNEGGFSKTASSVGGTIFSIGSQVTGGIVGTTYGLAQTDAKNGINAAVSGFVSGVTAGKAVGTAGKDALNNITDRRSTRLAAKAVAANYEAGEYDDEIGISEADRQLNTEKANAIRKAYADYARRSRSIAGKSIAGLRSKEGAQLDFYKAQLKILNESVDRTSDS